MGEGEKMSYWIKRLFSGSSTSLFVLLSTTPAFSGDCTSLIQGNTEYLKGYLNGLSTVVTTNQGKRSFASYTQMPLQDGGQYLVGSGDQYFSNRNYYASEIKTWAPFNPKPTDSLQIFIHKSPVKVEFKLNSWGGGVISSIPSCEGNVMFGTFNSGDSVYSLSFSKYRQIP
jgi:hypothetical protein